LIGAGICSIFSHIKLGLSEYGNKTVDNLVTANLQQRPVRSLLSAAGVALGVCLIMLFTGLAKGMSEELRRRSSNVKAEIIFTRSGGSVELTSSTTNLSTKYVDELKKIEGVDSALPLIRYVFQDNKGFGFEQVEGVDWDAFSKMNDIPLIEGRAPQGDDEVVVDDKKVQESHLSLGSLLPLFGGKSYRVVGVYSPESGARVKMTLAAMQNALEAPGKATYILVKTKNPEQQVEVARRINEQLPGNKVQFTRDVFTSVESRIPFLSVFLRVLVILSAIVSAIVVMLAMYTTITERTLGVIEKEALVIALIGLVAGFAVSFVAGFLISRVYGLLFEYGWGWALTASLIGFAGSALGAFYPAVRASGLDPVKALTYD
jgi:putative ABC transport system permease protein